MYRLPVDTSELFRSCILLLSVATLGCGGDGPTNNSATAQLVFAQQPGGAVAGQAFARQPVIEVRDGAGQLVSRTIAVTLTLTSGGTGATLSGTPLLTTVGGRANFADLAIDLTGSGFQLTASSPEAQSAVSSGFPVTGPIDPATSDVTVPAPLLLKGDTQTVTLRARDISGTPLTRGGSVVTFSLSDGTSAGVFGATADRADGTYTALFTAGEPGTPVLVRATIDGAEVTTPAPTLAVVAFASISAGQRHTCGTTTDGRALCWGSNAYGQLGYLSSGSSRPLQLPGSLVWTDIKAGHRNTCGLAGSGSAYCWGNNEYSQVGNDTWSVRQDDPAAVSGGLAFSGIEVGLGVTTGSVLLDQGFVVCGIAGAAEGYCWGDGRFGQIGDGTTDERAVPTAVSGGLAFGSIASGSMHSCGITTSGQAVCWGVNANGQLGIGSSPSGELCDGLICSTTPRSVSTSLLFQPGSLAVGTDHTCALSGEKAYCWGANRFGSLGDGTETSRTSPVVVPGLWSFTALTAGDAMTCALATVGETYCWGRAPGTSTARVVPTVVGGGQSFQEISAGGSHVCGLAASGAYCWGSNAWGQLGTGNLVSSTTPVRVRLR